MANQPITEWETTPLDELFPRRQAAWVRQWAYLWDHSDFYREKFSAAGLKREDVPDLRDLTALPFTVKAEMRESLNRRPPLGEHLAANRYAITQIQTSSGSTGRPLAISLTRKDADMFAEILRRGYVAAGFTPDDTILHAFSMSRGWIGGLCMVQGYLKLGCTLLPIGAEAGRDKILDIMEIFRPTGISATPGFIQSLGQRALERGINPRSLGLEHIFTGGEPGGGIPEVKRSVTEMWGATFRESMGGTDVTPICWAECKAETGMHFIGADAVWYEIIDPVTEEQLPMEVGTRGEIIYTHLTREATPIVRFKHRDIVEITGMERCDCGRVTPQIRCVGRADDMLIVKGVNLFPSSVGSVLVTFPGLGPNFRILKPKGSYTLSGPLVLKVEASGTYAPSAEELGSVLHQTLSVKFQVRYVPPGSLNVDNSHKGSFLEEV